MTADMDTGWDRDAWRAFLKAEELGMLDGITIERWEEIPEDICRDHELVGGRLVKAESGSPGHQGASLRLAIALDAATKKAVADGAFPCLKTAQDLDVRLWEVPSGTVRRPDVL